jgi:hypothetical protein
MIKKIGSMCCVIMLMICMLLISTNNAQAASQDPVLDGSYLTNENESIGYDTKITRGVDLLTGYSKCVRLGPGKIYAGGTTIAAHTVERVLVGVVIERAKKGDSAWSMYTGWQKENSNTDRAGSNRTLEVEGGYYYRVRSVHVANQDVSSSFTDGVYIE